MSLTASIAPTPDGSSLVLTVASDKRKVTVDVSAVGETAQCAGLFPVTVSDESGHVWTLATDDGTTAVYDY